MAAMATHGGRLLGGGWGSGRDTKASEQEDIDHGELLGSPQDPAASLQASAPCQWAPVLPAGSGWPQADRQAVTAGYFQHGLS